MAPEKLESVKLASFKLTPVKSAMYPIIGGVVPFGE